MLSDCSNKFICSSLFIPSFFIYSSISKFKYFMAKSFNECLLSVGSKSYAAISASYTNPSVFTSNCLSNI